MTPPIWQEIVQIPVRDTLLCMTELVQTEIKIKLL